MLWETIKLALRSIRRNVLRSFLTVLGVIIGVAAVITMVTLGRGSTIKVQDDIAKLGTNLLVLRPGQTPRGFGGIQQAAKALSVKDAEAIKSQVSGVRAIAPTASQNVTAVYGNQNWNTALNGADGGYLEARDWPLLMGRAFNDAEIRGGLPVCAIGTTVWRELFGASDPIGASIRMKKYACEVIGVMSSKGESSFGLDQDDLIITPLKSFQRRVAGNQDVTLVYISVEDGRSTTKVLADVVALMKERRNITGAEEPDFFARDLKEIADTLSSTTVVLTGLLSAVAAISLLVGGIGIMNIMLVSVTERTREIGTRLAIGALEGQVLMQFLVEAVVLSLFGGLIGVTLGLSLSWLLTGLLNVPFVLDPAIIAIAFGFSALVGVVFGYFPARKAARLDPIEALRHE
ncbi:MAG: ABC transporter permease [Hyphomicrobiales bacterium]|nr:ABC transporter permease [Hyphomicrobiales bacterium]